MTRRLLACAAALALLAVGCGATGDSTALPEASLQRLDGGEYQVHGPGEPRVLNLWATWCAPCRAELPAFDAVARRVEGVEIVGVNVGEDIDEAAELVAELDLAFTQVLDPVATIQRTLRITGMPSTIFVAADGSVLDIHSGELDEDELVELLAEHYDGANLVGLGGQ